MKYNFILFGIFAFFVSCNNQNVVIEKFSSSLYEIVSDSALSDTDYIIIIPNQGCGGCITGAEKFYEENKDASNVIFIFTNIISQKILNQKVSITHHNTYIDKTNIVLRAYPKGKSIYPCALTLRNKIIVGFEFHSPENDALSKVKTCN